MKDIFSILQIVFGLMVVALIMIQGKGGGLMQGLASGYLYRSKRGVEKIIFVSTIVFSFLFFAIAIANFTLFTK